MFRRARTILGDEDEARDVMQEVFVRVLMSDDVPTEPVPRLRWLYTITTRLSIDRLRLRRTRPTVSDPAAVEALVGESTDVADRRAVLQVLDRVDADTQAMVIHRYVDGLRLEDVAELAGTTRKTVAKRLEHFAVRARRLLGGSR